MTAPGWGEPRPPEPPDDRPFIDRNRKWLIPTVAVGLSLTLGVVAATFSGEQEPSDGDLRAGAELVCEDAVRDELTAPATADFTGTTASERSAGVWIVRGAVDAENGFGALVRSDFECRAVHVDGDRWRTRVETLEQR